MGSPVFHEFKRQASFFFKEKIKTARLALTNVTPVELLTEEATSGNMPSPNACSMGAISRAAFEIDDYWRIVDILHKRLSKFDTKNWRASYNALVLLEHLLSHGPLRVAEEFQNHKDSIKEMGSFQNVDEKGFDWGLSVRKLSEKILMLLENESFLKEERTRARKLTMGIKGFGRFGSQFHDHQDQEDHCFLKFNEKLSSSKEGMIRITEENCNQNMMHSDQSLETNEDGFDRERKHPFCEEYEQETAESLLSSIV